MRHIPGPGRIAQYVAGSAARVVLFPVRVALTRYARAEGGAQGFPDEGGRVLILLANAWGLGGTIRTVHNLASHLARSYDVEILSVVRRRERPFFEFPPGVRVTALDDRRPAARAAPRGLLPRLLERCPSVLMHPADARADEFNLRVDLELARTLRRRSGFLIGTRPGLNLLAAELASPSLVTVGQEHMHVGAHSGTLRRAIRRSYPGLDALVVLTEADARDYERLLAGKGRPRIERLPNTVRDLGARRADLSAPTVLAAGRLNRQKGFDLLLAAFGRVTRERPGWRLRICGQGQEREALERLVEAEGLTGVELPGPRDLGEEMANASVFVLSSRFEGLPLVLLEAMSMGMAVVSFDCPTGPREVVEHGRNGILVPPGDVEALAAAIVRVLDDEGLRRRLAEAAIETAAAYSVESVGRRWDALLAELAAERRTALGAGRFQ